MSQFAEADRCRAQLDRIGKERRDLRERERALTQEMIEAIREAANAGLHVTEIAKRLGVSRKTVHEYLRSQS